MFPTDAGGVETAEVEEAVAIASFVEVVLLENRSNGDSALGKEKADWSCKTLLRGLFGCESNGRKRRGERTLDKACGIPSMAVNLFSSGSSNQVSKHALPFPTTQHPLAGPVCQETTEVTRYY